MTDHAPVRNVHHLLPRPVPALLYTQSSEERAWRSRAALGLWLIGFSAERAWRLALSNDSAWSAYIRETNLVARSRTAVEHRVLARRLADLRTR